MIKYKTITLLKKLSKKIGYILNIFILIIAYAYIFLWLAVLIHYYA